MLKKLLLLILVALSISGFSQSQIDKEKFEIIFKNATSVYPAGEFKYSGYKINVPDGYKLARVKIKVKSSSKLKQLFDPNKMYLISRELGQRYRPVDIQYKILTGHYKGATRLTNDNKLSSGEEKKWYHNIDYIQYDSELKDTFKNYTIPSYKDNETRINYGSSRNPHTVVVYFDHEEIDSEVILIYFQVPRTLYFGDFYFGFEKVFECTFK